MMAVAMKKPEVCGQIFYVCDDSTDDADHECVLEKDHEKQENGPRQHKCKCGAWGDC